ncbi:MAG: glycosyltransferase [Candidatus Kryptoniota bacterium]
MPSCLQSVEGIADEIVIVDTGSTDSTIEIAKRFGAKIFHHGWHDDFAEARNVSLEAASGEWILVLDADEELPADTRNKIKDFTNKSSADGIELLIRSELPVSDPALYDDSRIVRLFRRRKEYRYAMPIHEQVRQSIEEAGGRIMVSDLVIEHHGYSHPVVQGRATGPARGEDRSERNLRMLYRALSNSPSDPYIHYQIGATLMSIGKRNEAYNELNEVLDLDYERLGNSVLDKVFMKISQLHLDRNNYEKAVEYAEKSLLYNFNNSISRYVAAIGYLSQNKIPEGYRYLLKIRETRDRAIRLDNQLDELIAACEKLLSHS